MQWLASISVRRPVFATVITLSLTVVGAFAFTQLGLDRFPKVDFPTVVVTTRFPGAAPEEVETEVTDQIEEAVNTISGIDELRSNSSEGFGQEVLNDGVKDWREAKYPVQRFSRKETPIGESPVAIVA